MSNAGWPLISATHRRFKYDGAVYFPGTMGISTMRLTAFIVLSTLLLSACENRNPERSDLEVFLLNLGQIIFDSAKGTDRSSREN